MGETRVTILGLLGRAIEAGVVLLEDALDRWTDRDGSRIMGDALRRTHDRAERLAAENLRLGEELDAMAAGLSDLRERVLNGPTLYRDEADAITAAIDWLTARTIPGQASSEATARCLNGLLARSSTCPMTLDEMSREIHKVISGEARAAPIAREDIGAWLRFDPEVSPAEEELRGRWNGHCDGSCPECRGQTDGGR